MIYDLQCQARTTFNKQCEHAYLASSMVKEVFQSSTYNHVDRNPSDPRPIKSVNIFQS